MEIGCIMEDTSVIALIWNAGDRLDASARFRKISEAQEKIGELVAQIEKAT